MQLYSVYRLKDDAPKEFDRLRADGELFYITDYATNIMGNVNLLIFKAYCGMGVAMGITTWYLPMSEFDKYFTIEITADELRKHCWDVNNYD